MKSLYAVTIVFSMCYLYEKGEAKLLKTVPHDYFDCPDLTKANTLVLSEVILVAGRWFQTVEKTLQYPPPGVIGTAPISCIMIKHEDEDVMCSYDLTISGGVGEKAIRFTARSKFYNSLKGLSLTVKIYTANDGEKEIWTNLNKNETSKFSLSKELLN